MRILILYRELAAYLVPTLEDVVKRFNAQITLVVYEINSEAPYVFPSINGVNIVRKLDFLHDQFVNSFDLLFCSGWADKDYLRIISQQQNKTVKVICFDTEWLFKWRKILGVIYLRLMIKNKFDYAFVPGKSSNRFGKFMGFSNKQIFRGVYSADVEKFSRLRIEVIRPNDRPKRFLFVGRYVKEKGIHDVCKAFAEFCTVSDERWELWCVGTGPEKINCIKHQKIKHLGFLQSDELVGILGDVDVFVMPSHSEPWGVVLHEMVLSGLPILVSNRVNSRELFLDEGVNGLEFVSGSVDDLILKMLEITILYKNKRKAMMDRSRKLGRLVMNNNWSLIIAKAFA
jgi:glycosyltransferase involved in cell wall biosynthesis